MKIGCFEILFYIFSKVEKMIPSSELTPREVSAVAITDLNTECLMEIFKHLTFTDLCAAADVCRLFRQSARQTFTYSTFKNVDLHSLCFKRDVLLPRQEKILLKQKLGQISKVLRLFGPIVKSMKIAGHRFKFKTKANYERAVFELIDRHCGGRLVELELVDCNLTYDVAIAMRPLLRHLRKLTLRDCHYERVFATMIPSWSPELRELQFSYESKSERLKNGFIKEMTFDVILRRPFPKLTTISFRQIFNVNSEDIDEFLKLNAQLKGITVIDCKGIDGAIFEPMAKYTSRIETVQIDVIDATYLKHFGKLKDLHALKICTSKGSATNNVLPLLLNEVSAAKIQLQQLHVLFIGSENFTNTEQLVEAICELKGLAVLELSVVPNLKCSHILDLCKQLKQLSELSLRDNGLVLSADNLIAW